MLELLSLKEEHKEIVSLSDPIVSCVFESEPIEGTKHSWNTLWPVGSSKRSWLDADADFRQRNKAFVD